MPQTLLDLLLQAWRQLLSQWAQSGALSRAAQDALQLDGEPEQLGQLLREWSEGDFSHLPPVVVLLGSAMPGAAGAYAISTGKIYLNADWLQSAGQRRVQEVLTEELGHHLDGLLNRSDSQGDEGKEFSNLLFGVGQSEIKANSNYHYPENGVIYIENTWINAEFSADYQPFTSRIISIADLAYLNSATLDGDSILIGGGSSVADIESSPVSANLGYIGSIAIFANIPTWTQVVPARRGETIHDIEITPTREIYTFGRSQVGFTTFGQYRGPLYDVTLSKYDSAGRLAWYRTTGDFIWNNPQSAAPDYPAAMAIDANGNIYISGITYRVIGSNPFAVFWGSPTGFVVSYTPDGDLRWTTLLGSDVEPVDLLVHPNGDVYLTGATYRDYDRHSFLARLHSISGQAIWLNRFGVPPAGVMAAVTPDIGNALAVDQLGMIYVAGTSTNTPVGDIGYIARFNPEGAREWSQFLTPGQQISTAKSIAIDSNRKIHVFGEAGKRRDGPYSSWAKDLYATVLDSDGNHIAYSIIETDEDEVAHKVMTGQDGSAFTIGSFFDSSGELQVVIGSNASNTGSAAFTITGTPVIGDTLSAINSTSDPDGNGPFTYTWQTSSNGSTWATVGGNRASYRISTSDSGKQLRLVVTYRDGKGIFETVTTSAGTVAYTPSREILEILAKDSIYEPTHGLGASILGQFGSPYSIDWILNGAAGLYALGLTAANAAPVLVLRGTTPTDVLDIWDDINPDGIGHGQFTKNINDIRNWLLTRSNNIPPVIVGHSLGGALAQWIAADATKNLSIRLGEVVTFNSPGIATLLNFNGIEIGASTFKKEMAGLATHYITSPDPISLGGLKYIDGSATLVDYNASRLYLLGPHLDPVLVGELPTARSILPPFPKLRSADDRIFSALGINALNSPGFSYLSDYDFVERRLAISGIVLGLLAGGNVPLGTLIFGLNSALVSRASTESFRQSLGSIPASLLSALRFALDVPSIIAEMATERVQQGIASLKRGGAAALAAANAYTSETWQNVASLTASQWQKTQNWTSNAWRDTVEWTSDTWQAISGAAFDLSKPFITTAAKRLFFLPASAPMLRFAAASQEPSEDPDPLSGAALFSMAAFSAPASYQTINVPIALSQPSTEVITLNFDTIDATAIAGVDYISRSGSLRFEPGETEKIVAIDLLAPDSPPVEKGFKVRISNLQNAQFLTSEDITVVFKPNAPPVVALPPADQFAPIEEPLFLALPPDTFSDGNSSDGDGLQFTAMLADGSPLPNWLNFDPATQAFSGTPPADALGILEIDVTATDASQTATTARFRLNVVAYDGPASFAIAGTLAVGNTLTASTSTPDPDGNGTFSYSWQSSAKGASWSTEGTNSNTYTVASTDQGKQLRLVVTYTDAEGFSELITTAAGSVPFVNDGSATFAITGTPAVGNALTASATTSDPDGNGTFSYAWQSSPDGITWSPVGTNSSSYQVGSADQGRQLRLQVSYTDAEGFAESLTIPYGWLEELPTTAGGTHFTVNDPLSPDLQITSQGSPDLVELQAAVSATLYARTSSTWSSGFVAYNSGSPTAPGTGERIPVTGLGRYSFVATAIPEATTAIVLEPDQNTAYFLHDTYSAFFSGLNLQPDRYGRASAQRLLNIDTITMGSAGGTSIVDLTSPEYITGPMTVLGAASGTSIVWGSDADDSYISAGSDAVIYGGLGRNTMTLGSGRETLQYRKMSASGGAIDKIRSFDPSMDRLQFWVATDQPPSTPMVTNNASSSLLAWGGHTIEFLDQPTLSLDDLTIRQATVS